MIAALIILLATIENIAPLIIGWGRTPPGYVFLGTVHHPADYFYYLSQFAQGAYRWATAIDLYTSEAIGPSYIGWSNVLMGKLGAVFGLPAIAAYHVSVALLTIALLVVAYKLARTILASQGPATLALYLLVLFHAFPILRDGKPSYGDYWNNFAVPLARMGSVPHQLLLAIASILVVYFSSKLLQRTHNRQHRVLIGLIFFSFILASLQPALWTLIWCSIGITAFIYMLIHRDKINQLNNFIIPALYVGIGGLLPALYLHQRFLTAPFLQLKLWEATQQTHFTWNHFLSATGPIFILALMSSWWFLKDRSATKLFLVVLSCLSYLLFLSPIPQAFGLSHVRFMSTLTILCISIIAAYGIDTLCARLVKSKIFSWKKFTTSSARLLIYAIILIPLMTYLLPNHLTTIRLASNFATDNAYQYLTKGDYELLQTAAKLSNPSDTFLIIWPYTVVFPGLTGRKTYAGHPLLTINARQKEETANRFFNNELTAAKTQEFLTAHRISHIITYSWTALPRGLYDILAQGGSLALYRVNHAHLKSYSK